MAAPTLGARTTGGGTASSRTISHTPNAGATRLLVGFGYYDASSVSISSVTWRGSSTGVTQRVTRTNNSRNVTIYEIDTPGSGSGSLVVTWSGSCDHEVEVLDVVSSDGFRALSGDSDAGNSTTVDVTIDPTSSADGGDFLYGAAEFKRGGAYDLEASSGTELSDIEVVGTPGKLFFNTQHQVAAGSTSDLVWTASGTGGNTHAECGVAMQPTSAVNATVSAVPGSASGTAPSPTPAISVSASASGDAQAPAPTPALTVPAAPGSASAAAAAPTITVDTTIAAAPASSAAVAPAPTPALRVEAGASAAGVAPAPTPAISVAAGGSADATAPAPTLVVDRSISATPAAAVATASAPTPQITLSAIGAAAAEAPAPTPTIDIPSAPAAATAAASAPTPAITVEAGGAAAGEAPAPTPEVRITAAPAAAAAEIAAPAVSTDASNTVIAVPASAGATAPSPTPAVTVETGGSAAATAPTPTPEVRLTAGASAAAEGPAPTVSTTVLILAPAATAAAEGNAPNPAVVAQAVAAIAAATGSAPLPVILVPSAPAAAAATIQAPTVSAIGAGFADAIDGTEPGGGFESSPRGTVTTAGVGAGITSSPERGGFDSGGASLG